MGLFAEKVEVDLREDRRNWKIPGGHDEAGPQGRSRGKGPPHPSLLKTTHLYSKP